MGLAGAAACPGPCCVRVSCNAALASPPQRRCHCRRGRHIRGAATPTPTPTPTQRGPQHPHASALRPLLGPQAPPTGFAVTCIYTQMKRRHLHRMTCTLGSHLPLQLCLLLVHQRHRLAHALHRRLLHAQHLALRVRHRLVDGGLVRVLQVGHGLHLHRAGHHSTQGRAAQAGVLRWRRMCGSGQGGVGLWGPYIYGHSNAGGIASRTRGHACPAVQQQRMLCRPTANALWRVARRSRRARHTRHAGA